MFVKTKYMTKKQSNSTNKNSITYSAKTSHSVDDTEAEVEVEMAAKLNHKKAKNSKYTKIKYRN